MRTICTDEEPLPRPLCRGVEVDPGRFLHSNMIYDFKSVEIINSGVIISELREEIWGVREPSQLH